MDGYELIWLVLNRYVAGPDTYIICRFKFFLAIFSQVIVLSSLITCININFKPLCSF